MMVTFLVVCLPRPARSETSPTAWRSIRVSTASSPVPYLASSPSPSPLPLPSHPPLSTSSSRRRRFGVDVVDDDASDVLRSDSALMMELLPAPDGPATTVTSPFSLSSSASSPISLPSWTLTATQSYPHASSRRTSSRTSPPDTRSHLFSTTVTGRPVCSADTRYRVAALGIKGGMARENTSMTLEMLATGGSSSLDERGKTSSTMPRPSTQSMPTTRTTSPTSTWRFIFLSRARTTHNRRVCGGGDESANGSPPPVRSTLIRTKLACAAITRPMIAEGRSASSPASSVSSASRAAARPRPGVEGRGRWIGDKVGATSRDGRYLDSSRQTA